MSHSQRSIALIIDDPLLVFYAQTVKKSVIAARLQFEARKQSVQDAVEKQYDEFPELKYKVLTKKTEVQLHTKGIPATEAVMRPDMSAADHQLYVANKFLVKKAYREAAALAHPDKGGSNEEFAAVSAAYRQNDLDSLTEFVLARQKGVLDQIRHWSIERRKPEVLWMKLCSTPEYRIAQAVFSGNKTLASARAEFLLKAHIQALDLQLFHLIQTNHENLSKTSGEARSEIRSESKTDGEGST